MSVCIACKSDRARVLLACKPHHVPPPLVRHGLSFKAAIKKQWAAIFTHFRKCYAIYTVFLKCGQNDPCAAMGKIKIMLRKCPFRAKLCFFSPFLLLHQKAIAPFKRT